MLRVGAVIISLQCTSPTLCDQCGFLDAPKSYHEQAGCETGPGRLTIHNY